MAGVLFIIWIPCERYEQILSSRPIRLWRKNGEDHDELTYSSTEGVIDQIADNKKVKIFDKQQNGRAGSMDTLAISIESDSLNKKDSEKSDENKRTRSADDLTSDKITIDNRPRPQGSMDSDQFRRLMKNEANKRENQEAIDRFFGVETSLDPILDANSPMEKVVREIIDQLHIRNSTWVRVNHGNCYQVTFSLENGVRCDDTIHFLSSYGIGQKEGSSVAIVPCTLYTDSHRKLDDEDTSSTQTIKETSWNKFISSVRARMNVAKIVEAVKGDASLTFDFVILLIVAGILAAFGLVENSTLFLAASMLISPLMGPILAATFGAVIKDHKLQYWGLRNEIIGIFMCMFVGFFFGSINCGFDYFFGSEKKLILTDEMLARTNVHSVIVGICIALPSGAAVAIAVLGENFGSLVGVAISASLLPPSVNTGLLWSYSFIHYIFKGKTLRFEKLLTEKMFRYASDEALELFFRGGMSLLVTLTNVLCIYFMGFIFLKLKEVAPVSADQRQFWKHDIKVARDYNKTINADEGRKLEEEFAQFQENASENFRGVGAELLKSSRYQTTNMNLNTWSPLTLRHHQKANNTSLRNLDTLFSLKKSEGDRHLRGYLFPSMHDTSDLNKSESMHYRDTVPIISSVGPSSEIRNGQAPLEVITESPNRIQHQSTLVNFERSPGPSNTNKKKFIVTPAVDPLM